MEDSKSSAFDPQSWFGQAAPPADPTSARSRSNRSPGSTRGEQPDVVDPAGSLTDREAYEVLAAGMAEAPESEAPAAEPGSGIETGDGDGDPRVETIIKRNTGDGTFGNEFPTARIEWDVIARGAADDHPDDERSESVDDAPATDNPEARIDLFDEAPRKDRARSGDASLTASGDDDVRISTVASFDDLPPLVVIPDEQRNHRRNPAQCRPAATVDGSALAEDGFDRHSAAIDGRSESTRRSGGGEGLSPGEDGLRSGGGEGLSPGEDGPRSGGGEDLSPGEDGPRSGGGEDLSPGDDGLPPRSHDVGELERVYDRYAGPVVAVAASVLTERTEIADALFETFATAWRASSSFESSGPNGPWLFKLARRCAQDRALSDTPGAAGHASGLYPVPAHRGESVAGMDSVWEAWEVRRALEQLPLSDRNVIRLIHYQGLIDPEIAAELGIPVGTVKARAHNGSQRLVKLLDHVIRPGGGEPPDNDLASAFTWYLSGLADGSELAPRHRDAIRRIQHQLASAPAWIQPAPAVRTRLAELVLATPSSAGHPRAGEPGHHRTRPGPSGPTTEHYDMARAEELFDRDHYGGPVVVDEIDVAAPEQDRGNLILVAVTVAAALMLLVWTGWRSTGDSGDDTVSGTGGAVPDLPAADDVEPASPVTGGPGDVEVGIDDPAPDSTVQPDTTLVYELVATDVDIDAAGLVMVTPAAGGARYELQIQQLAASEGDQFLAVWLVNGSQWGHTGGDGSGRTTEAQQGDAGADVPPAIPLGSFQWAPGVGPLRFSSAAVDTRFDTVIVTRQRPTDPIGPSGPVVFYGSLGS